MKSCCRIIIFNIDIGVFDRCEPCQALGGIANAAAITKVFNTCGIDADRCAVPGSFPAGGRNAVVDEHQATKLDDAHDQH